MSKLSQLLAKIQVEIDDPSKTPVRDRARLRALLDRGGEPLSEQESNMLAKLETHQGGTPRVFSYRDANGAFHVGVRN